MVQLRVVVGLLSDVRFWHVAITGHNFILFTSPHMTSPMAVLFIIRFTPKLVVSVQGLLGCGRCPLVPASGTVDAYNRMHGVKAGADRRSRPDSAHTRHVYSIPGVRLCTAKRTSDYHCGLCCRESRRL